MKIYSPGEIAELLAIKESTLRKYSLMLENVGYSFQRNNQNQRWYNDTDIVTFRKFISLKNSTDMSLKECADAVFLWAKGKNIANTLTVTESDTERHNEDIEELKALIHIQNEMIRELAKRLDQQQEYIDKRLNEHDKILTESLRESLEVQKMIATTQEAKKGFLGGIRRLFGG